MQANIAISVPHAWQYVRTIRHKVEEALSELHSAARSATVMTASELAENAIKYGESVTGAPSITFAMSVDDDVVRVEVTNGSHDVRGVRALQQRIQEVTRAPDKTTLYMARLEELMSNPTESGKLGIYRIAFEGRFDLTCRYEDNIVTVVGTRAAR